MPENQELTVCMTKIVAILWFTFLILIIIFLIVSCILNSFLILQVIKLKRHNKHLTGRKPKVTRNELDKKHVNQESVNVRRGGEDKSQSSDGTCRVHALRVKETTQDGYYQPLDLGKLDGTCKDDSVQLEMTTTVQDSYYQPLDLGKPISQRCAKVRRGGNAKLQSSDGMCRDDSVQVEMTTTVQDGYYESLDDKEHGCPVYVNTGPEGNIELQEMTGSHSYNTQM